MHTVTAGGKTVEVTSARGSVVGLAVRSDTYVSGSGGANNTDVRVTSTVLVKKEFHIQPANSAAQLAVQLAGLDIPLMNGQDVTMLMATRDGANFKYFVRLVNHSSQRCHRLIGGSDLATKLKLLPIHPAWSVWPWGIGMLLPLKGAGTWGFFGMIGMLAWLAVSRRSAGKRLDQQLDDLARVIVNDATSESQPFEQAAAASLDLGASQEAGGTTWDATSVPAMPLPPAEAQAIGSAVEGVQQQPVESQIKRLEKCLVVADLPGATAIIDDLHRRQAELDAGTKRNVNQLEAVFLSLVQAQVEKLKSDPKIKAPESAKERFEAFAAEWVASGRPKDLLSGSGELMTIRCWVHSDGGKKEGASDTLREFISAGQQAKEPDWLDKEMSERETCRACGESYRSENLAVCTHCARKYCYTCTSQNGKAANGNSACRCGGELVG